MIEQRIYSAVDADEELVGTYGWFADTVADMKKLVRKNDLENLSQLVEIGGEYKRHRFQQTSSCYAPFSLYMPVCRGENREAQLAWLQGKPVSVMRGNVRYTYVRGNGADPNFLDYEDFSVVVERPYKPFGTIDEFIEGSGVKVNPKGKGSRPFIWLRSRQYGTDWLVVSYNDETKNITIGSIQYSLADVFEQYTFLDGSPCGKVEA